MAWKIKPINLAWNQITGRTRKPLVLPKRNGIKDTGIPTAEVTLTVELIEEYRVLKKFVLNDMYCFLIVDEVEGIKIISFDEEGRPFNAMLPDSIRYAKQGPHGYRDEYWLPNEEKK